MVKMKIGGHPIDLMVVSFSNKHATIIGATGDWVHHPFLMARQCNLGIHEVRHEFLYLLIAPWPCWARICYAK
jgi:hypothetical protein